MWPQPEPTRRAFERGGQTWLAAAGPLGVVCAPCQPDTPPALWATLLDSVGGSQAGTATPCVSEPACAALAEQLLQHPPEIAGRAEQMLSAAQGQWDLAQFAFSQSAQARRGHWLRDTARTLLHAPAWQPVRWGLVALVLLQVAALNITAWRSQQALAATQAQIRQTLTERFPQITLVLDAPVQMRRAVADLRQASGNASPRDLEALLQDLAPAAAQWDTLEHSAGQATLTGFRVSPQADNRWQDRLEAAGWTVQLAGEPPVLTLKARP